MAVFQKTSSPKNSKILNQEEQDLKVLLSREKEKSLDKKSFLALLKTKFKI